MKQLSNLFPIGIVASTAAIVAPLATSCSLPFSYTNMLRQYAPGVTPYPGTSFDSKETAQKGYAARVERNHDVFRDDAIYSLSSALNINASRTELNKLFTFSRYYFNIYVDCYRTLTDDLNFGFRYYADITGFNKDTTFKIDGHWVTDFDFYIQFSLDDGAALTINDKQTTALALKDLYLITMDLSNIYCKIKIEGSYSYNDAGTTGRVNDYFVNDNFVIVPENGNRESWLIADHFMFQIDRIAYLNASSPISKTTYAFVSHYFKDARIW